MTKNIIPLYTSADKIIVKSEDCYQYDSEGKQYIDFESGVWCVNVGHSNQRVIQLIEKQIAESIHHGYKFRNTPSEELSMKLLQISGLKNGASVFLSSGSEAVDLSIRLSRHITGRKRILKIDTSYLSAYGFGRALDENENNVVSIPFDNIGSINDIDFIDIAVFVLETGCASNGVVRFPEYHFVNEIVKRAKENGCLIVAEEVTTGMGRTGRWFGFQYYDIIPDMLVTGKALGNGYPVSSVTVSAEIEKRFDESPFTYAQSHQNDPLGCFIGLEVIKIIEDESLIEKSIEKGLYFKQRLDAIKIKHQEKVKDSRGRGLMLALEFEEHINGAYINDQLFASGFVVGFKNNTLRFLPPLTIIEYDIDRLVDKIDNLLKQEN